MKVLPYIVKKEFLQLRRDKRMLPIVLIAPVLQLVLLGYAANLDVEDIPTAVYDADRTSTSRALAESFFAGGVFVPLEGAAGTVTNPAEAEKLLVSGKATAVLSIPPDFDKSLGAGRSGGGASGGGRPGGAAPTVQLLVDGTNSTEGIAAINYGRAIVADFAGEQMMPGSAAGDLQGAETAGRGPAIRLEPRVWYNPELESRNYMVPGILALLLMVITMLLSSLAIVKEKELGTLEQLNVTPIRSEQLIIGKLMPFVIIGFADVGLVVLVARFVFQVPLTGSVALLFAMSTIFLATTLGLGLLISTVSNNQQQAMMTSVFFVMVPMFFLSGFAFPIESMPRVIQWVSYLLPLRYYFVVIRGIFLKGAGIASLWDEGLAMLLFGGLILLLSALRFKKRSS